MDIQTGVGGGAVCSDSTVNRRRSLTKHEILALVLELHMLLASSQA